MSVAQKLVGAARLPKIVWSFSRIGYRRRQREFAAGDLDVSLAGTQAFITGANAGLGYAIAEALARRDADLWMLCRNEERADDARARLDVLGAGRVRVELVDMADLESIDALVERLDAPRVDILVHNAGALVHEYGESGPGLETTLICHVVGPQRLNHGLRDRLLAADDPRVVYVSSGGMYSERLDVADLFEPPRPFDGVRAYALAKRAQVVLTEQWAAHLPGVRFFAMHPGWADTGGVERALPGFYKRTRRWLRTPAEGADTAVWLAIAPNLDLPSGTFAFDRAVARTHILPGTRATEDERHRLWKRVEALAQPNP